jgi:hypothetical protein
MSNTVLKRICNSHYAAGNSTAIALAKAEFLKSTVLNSHRRMKLLYDLEDVESGEEELLRLRLQKSR